MPATILVEALESRQLLSLTFTSLATFSDGTPPPASTMAIDAGGNLFGTTKGGATGRGSIWELKKTNGVYDASITTLATFPADGSFGTHSRNGLVIDSQGNLYGTNADGFGGASVGVLWKLPHTNSGYGSLELIKAFTDLSGQTLGSLLSVDASDNVYGIADGLIDVGPKSTVFKVTPAGDFSTLVAFNEIFAMPGGIGGPQSQLVMDTAGNLYGTAINGGDDHKGSVFMLPVSNGYSTITNIASFTAVQSNPFGHVSILNSGASSKIFGIAEGDNAGHTNSGVVWELDVTSGVPDGAVQSLGTFTDANNGANPAGGAFLAPDGNLYGTTTGVLNDTSVAQTVWECTNTAGVFSAPMTVATFPSNPGTYPETALVSDGTNLFGLTTDLSTGTGGAVFGVGPADIPHGGNGGGGGGGGASITLAPTVNATLPTDVVGGTKAKGAKVSVTVTNSGTADLNDSVTIGLFVSSDTTLDGNDTPFGTPVVKKLKLKVGAHKVIKLKLAAFPSAVPDGSYFVLAQTTAATATGGSGSSTYSVNIAAPFIDLDGGFPAPAKTAFSHGKKASLPISIGNEGNVIASGTVAADLALRPTTGGSDVALPAVPLKLKLKAKSFKNLKLNFLLPDSVTPGSYFLVATIDPTGSGITETNATNNVIVGDVALTVS